jgi:NAD(P)-dependent dehydrogenase (short-subunit alcohol dehydrogenase family)
MAGAATGRPGRSPAASVTAVASLGPSALTSPMRPQVAELVAAITGRFGPVDVLVLNATGPQPR